MYILDSDILIPKDKFYINESIWYRLIYPILKDAPLPKTNNTVLCEVLRVYCYSSIELIYVCKTLNKDISTEFILRHILEDLYTFKLMYKSEDISVSALVIQKLENISNVKPYDTNPCIYKLEDINTMKSNLDKLDLKVENDYVIV